jgi:hypothetical protein
MNFPTFSLIGKLFGLPRGDRLLLLEATVFLAIAGVAVAMVPFRYLGLLATRPIRKPAPLQRDRLIKVRRIRWAILATAARVPWRAKCFEQGLAAQLMLRRRGILSVLYYGATQDDRNGLSMHVWVRDGDVDVVGGEIACQFAILATFPQRPVEENS